METSDKKTVLAILLCTLIYFLWSSFTSHQFPPPAPPQTNTTQVQVPPTNPSNFLAPPTTQTQETYWETSDSQGSMLLSEQTGRLKNGSLAHYLQPKNRATGTPVDLFSVSHSAEHFLVSFDDPRLAYLATAVGSTQDGVWTFEDENIRLIKTFEKRSNAPFLRFNLEATFKNPQIRPQFMFVSLHGQKSSYDADAPDQQFIAQSAHGTERFYLKDAIPTKPLIAPVEFVALSNRHFLFAMVNKSPLNASGLLQPTLANAGRMSLVFPITSSIISVPVAYYFGPKDGKILKQVSPHLAQTIDYGFFSIFAEPLLLTLNLFFSFCKNYGLAIIFLTIALKLLTLPLSLKGMSSMKKMSTLQPKIAALKAQFKDNPSQLNLETAKLMKTEGYNPIAGCLPLLIQIPVFFALYRVLYTAVELYQAPFIFWIKDLSTPDPYYVLPALTAGAMFWQQKLSPNPGMDPAQAKVMQFMPLLFGLFSVTAPSGLAIYILVNTLATAVQTLFTNRKIPWVKFGLPKGYLEPKI